MNGESGKTRLLFLGVGNSCRTQMAEGFARAGAPKGLEVASAGLRPVAIQPLVVEVMKEAGVDIAAHRAKGLADLAMPFFDVVITIGPQTALEFPLLPGDPETLHWKIADPPAGSESPDAQREGFRRMREEIRQRIEDLLGQGYLAALVEVRRKYERILNYVTDGVLAHDMEQRIVFFNDAAERITGYDRGEVLNRRCSEVFPGGLCGGKCLFTDPANLPDLRARERTVDIVTKSGERRTTQMFMNPRCDHAGRAVEVVISFRDVTREQALARRVGAVEQFAGIVGQDQKMLAIFDLIKDLADSNAPVMIQGESGTGKELIAAAIHNEGHRAHHQFVAVNCGALPEGLLESELFGHVRGAFTGAVRDKKGRFEIADGGTILLDEIGDISPAMQVKLLRVLQEGRFERVGSEETLKVDVRVISATNKDIREEIAAKRFREDLYYRLNVVPIMVPPVRERPNDIPAIADAILKRAALDAGRLGMTLSTATLDLFISYPWPGNVREMQNWIQFAMVKCKDSVIEPKHLPPIANGPAGRPAQGDPMAVKSTAGRKLDTTAVNYALKKAGGNRTEAARLLGVSRATLYRFLGAEGSKRT